MANPQIREAAQSLLVNVNNPNYRTLTNSQTLPFITEDFVAGHRLDGKMSSVRRSFCLIVTFDVMFTGLMWLICVVMRGETFQQILYREIIHYDVKASLFDVVLLAISRFIILLLFYGLLYINNWSVIALSTGLTCALLIAKVFVFDWPDAAQPVFQVFLIVTSFVVAWAEAWYLDFRVIPQEGQAASILEFIVNSRPATAPLTPRPATVAASDLGSASNWFSPVESLASTPVPPTLRRSVILTQEQIDEYKSLADQSMQNAWRVVNLSHWKLEKRGANGDVVESTTTEQFGKVYRFTGLVAAPAKFLYEEFKENISRLPEWNPTILKSERIKEIAPGVDLSYQVTAGGGRGIISARDFVILRRCAPLTRNGSVVDNAGAGCAEPHCFISSGVSVSVPGYPPTASYVRGHNKVGCWLLKNKQVTTSGGKLENHTIFQWLMCCDLKGKIPQFVLDAAFATVMLDYIVHVRKFVADCKAKGMF